MMPNPLAEERALALQLLAEAFAAWLHRLPAPQNTEPDAPATNEDAVAGCPEGAAA